MQFEKHLAIENVKKLITQADGYQPHLIAPEQGYRRLIESCLVSIKGPAEAAVDAVCHAYLFILYISPTEIIFSFVFYLLNISLTAHLFNSVPEHDTFSTLAFGRSIQYSRSLFTGLSRRHMYIFFFLYLLNCICITNMIL